MTDDATVPKSGVYRIDFDNGWYYFGSSQDLPKRERQHRWHLRRGVHCNKMMQNAYNKYGSFVFTVLDHCQVEDLTVREQALIDANFADTNCVNIVLVVGSPTAGRKATDETLAKMRVAATGYKHSDEARAKMSFARRGKVASDETRSKMSRSSLGKKKSPAHCAAISAAQIGRKKSPAHCAAIGAASKGRKHSDESRAKISAAASARWAQVRDSAATT